MEQCLSMVPLQLSTSQYSVLICELLSLHVIWWRDTVVPSIACLVLVTSSMGLTSVAPLSNWDTVRDVTDCRNSRSLELKIGFL